MLKRYLLALPALCLAGFVQPAQAQVVIDPAQAVAPPRTDPGTGICATTLHLLSGSFNTPEDATRVLDNRADPNIDNNPPPPSRLFTAINLRNNDANSAGDFTGAKWPDELMSYSLPPDGDRFRISVTARTAQGRGRVRLEDDVKPVGAAWGTPQRGAPWLATGALSARRILAELRRYEAEHGATDGTYWLWFELL